MIITVSSHLQHPQAFQKKFQLKAKPTIDQPGNGMISIYKDGGFISRPYGKEMVEDLWEMYDGHTSAFARHLKALFQKNETFAEYPFVTSEVYMLLLFEIGRRSVEDSRVSSTRKKRKLDKLPIKEAIDHILTLFANKQCGFRDVFLKRGRYHCFTGPPKRRRKAIKKIKNALPVEGETETESRGESGDSELPEHLRNLTL